MGSENQSPLNELQLLDQQVDQTTELAGLKPIFFRVDELAKEYPGDFEVQLAASEVKQRVVARGTVLKQLGQTMQGAVPVIADLAPPPMPPSALANSSTFQAPPVLGDQSPPPPQILAELSELMSSRAPQCEVSAFHPCGSRTVLRILTGGFLQNHGILHTKFSA